MMQPVPASKVEQAKRAEAAKKAKLGEHGGATVNHRQNKEFKDRGGQASRNDEPGGDGQDDGEEHAVGGHGHD